MALNRSFLGQMAGGAKSEEARNIFQMAAYASVFLQKENSKVEEGDKIVLPSSVLDTLTRNFGLLTGNSNRKMPSPLIFECTNKKFDKSTHVGVLEFAAPKRAAFLPKWMMDNLQLADGDNVQLRLRELPKAAKVVFQPRKFKFTKIPDPTTTLQYALRTYTALTQGDTIVITHAHDKYELDVVSVEPNKLKPTPAVCLIDTTVKVEFEAPLEPAPAELKPTDIRINEKHTTQLKANEWGYFRLRLVDPNMGVKISVVDTTAGDPDLYVSVETEKPGPTSYNWKSENKQSTPKSTTSTGSAASAAGAGAGAAAASPSATASPMMTAGNRLGSAAGYRLTSPSTSSAAAAAAAAGAVSESVTIDISDPKFSKSWYWIAVHAYDKPAAFAIIAEEETPLSEKADEKKGSVLGSTATGGAAGAGAGTALGHATTHNPDDKQCSNCLAWMPPSKYTMHTITCERMNWRCPDCNKVLRKAQKDTHTHCPKCHIALNKDELKKHLDLAHATVACAQCGAKMEPDLLDVHSKEACPNRLVNCKFCNVTFPMADLEAHEAYCGGKGVPCDLCGKDVPRKKMQIHMAVEHGINPSIVPGSGPVGKPFVAGGGGAGRGAGANSSGSGAGGGAPHKTGGSPTMAARPAPTTPAGGGRGGAAARPGGGGGGSNPYRTGMGDAGDDALAAALAASRRDADRDDDAELAAVLAASLEAATAAAPPRAAAGTPTGGAGGAAGGGAAAVTPKPKPSAAPAPAPAEDTSCPYCRKQLPDQAAMMSHLLNCPSLYE